MWGGTQDDKRTINFGLVRIRTLATCVPGVCFIHCAMPLWLVIEPSYKLSQQWGVLVIENAYEVKH